MFPRKRKSAKNTLFLGGSMNNKVKMTKKKKKIVSWMSLHIKKI
jgi:hypothetical protein